MTHRFPKRRGEGPPPPPPEPSEDRWTIGRLLTWTTDFLTKKGAESPRLDAEVLLAQALGCKRVELYTRYEHDVAEKDRAVFREFVRKRAEGMPVAYLVGRKEFFSLTLTVSKDVLIPRPDTETIVVEFLGLFKARSQVRAVDVGTGSGAIALACLSRHDSARFLATDLSEKALAVAKANAQRLGLDERISFHQGDLLEALDDPDSFDAVLSNPPYIASAEIDSLEPGVRDYEPRLALDGGADGLRVVTRLIDQAANRLKPGGHLLLEIGSAQETTVRDLIAERPDFELAPTVKDAANHPRVVRARRRP